MRNIWAAISGFLILVLQIILSICGHQFERINPISLIFKYIYFIGIMFIFIWCIIRIKNYYISSETVPAIIIFVLGFLGILLFILFEENRDHLLMGYSAMMFLFACFEVGMFLADVYPFIPFLVDCGVYYTRIIVNLVPFVNLIVPAAIIIVSFLKFRPTVTMLIVLCLYILHIVFLLAYGMILGAVDEIMKNEQEDMDTPLLNADDFKDN